MGFLRKYDVFLGITMIFMVTIQVLAETEQLKEDLSVKGSFVNMLKNIVNANEKRMFAIKRIADLQDYMVTKSRPSFTEFDIEESAENEDAVIALLNVMHNNTYRRAPQKNDLRKPEIPILYIPVNYYTNKIKPDHENIEHYKSLDISNSKKRRKNNIIRVGVSSGVKNRRRKLDIEVKDILIKDQRRRRSKSFRDTCAKEAKKLCKEACRDAYRSFCRVYSCSPRAKRRFRTECKYSCNSKFKTSTYSDDDIE